MLSQIPVATIIFVAPISELFRFVSSCCHERRSVALLPEHVHKFSRLPEPRAHRHALHSFVKPARGAASAPRSKLRAGTCGGLQSRIRAIEAASPHAPNTSTLRIIELREHGGFICVRCSVCGGGTACLAAFVLSCCSSWSHRTHSSLPSLTRCACLSSWARWQQARRYSWRVMRCYPPGCSWRLPWIGGLSRCSSPQIRRYAGTATCAALVGPTVQFARAAWPATWCSGSERQDVCARCCSPCALPGAAYTWSPGRWIAPYTSGAVL